MMNLNDHLNIMNILKVSSWIFNWRKVEWDWDEGNSQLTAKIVEARLLVKINDS